MKRALIIFIKNPELGMVKTRLAVKLGIDKALEIYLKLLNITKNSTVEVEADRFLFYSRFIDNSDFWQPNYFQKELQKQDPDLGIRMLDAFIKIRSRNLELAILVGSDIPGLRTDILERALQSLEIHDAGIGCVKDGGYYAIGFNYKRLGNKLDEVLKEIFLNKTWSHDLVAQQAKLVFEAFHLNYFEMPILHDVDTEDDLKYMP